jgi:hypothetical protein
VKLVGEKSQMAFFCQIFERKKRRSNGENAFYFRWIEMMIRVNYLLGKYKSRHISSYSMFS